MEPSASAPGAPHGRSSPPAQLTCSSPASGALAPVTSDEAAMAPLNSSLFVPRLSPQAEISSLDLGTSLSVPTSSDQDPASQSDKRPQPQPVQLHIAPTSTATTAAFPRTSKPAVLCSVDQSRSSKRQLPPHLDINVLERNRAPARSSAADARRTSTDDGSSAGVEGARFPSPPSRDAELPTWRSEKQPAHAEATSAAGTGHKPGTWRLRNGSHPTRPALQPQDHMANQRQDESTQEPPSLEDQDRPVPAVEPHSSTPMHPEQWHNDSATLARPVDRGDGDASLSEQGQATASSRKSPSTLENVNHAAAETTSAERQRLRSSTLSASVPLPHPSTLPRPTMAASFAPTMQPLARFDSFSAMTHDTDIFANMAGAGPPSAYPPPTSSSRLSSTDSVLLSRKAATLPAPPLFVSASFSMEAGSADAESPLRIRMPSVPPHRISSHGSRPFATTSQFAPKAHSLPVSSPVDAGSTSERLARLDRLRRTVEQQELALQQGCFDAETAQTQLEHFQEELRTLQRAVVPAPLPPTTPRVPPPLVLAGLPAGQPAAPLPLDEGDEVWWNEQIRVQQQYNSGGGPSPNNRRLSLYKTELCRSWEERGNCRYGVKCQFAHGSEELRPVQRHAKYKTEICRTFWRTGQCPYARRCCFIHKSPGDAPSEESKTDEVNRSRVPLLARVGVSSGAASSTTPERCHSAIWTSPRSSDVAVSVLHEALASTPSWAENLRRERAHSSASVRLLDSTDFSGDGFRRIVSVESLPDAADRARGTMVPSEGASGDAGGARSYSSPPGSAVRLPDFAPMRSAAQQPKEGTAASIWNPAVTTDAASRRDDRGGADFFGPLRSAFEQRSAHGTSSTSTSTPRSLSCLSATSDSPLGARTTGIAAEPNWRQQVADGDAPSHCSSRSSSQVFGLGLSGISLRDRSSSNATTSSALSLDRDAFSATALGRSSPPSSPTEHIFGARRSEPSKAAMHPQQARRTAESVLNTPGSTRTSTTLSSDAGSPWTPSRARELGADIAFSERETAPAKLALTSDDITFGDSSEESFRSSSTGSARPSAHFDNGVFFSDR